jgi:hypothetical protein
MVEGVKGWQIRWYSLSVEGPAVTEDFWTATSMALVVPQTTTPGKISPKGGKKWKGLERGGREEGGREAGKGKELRMWVYRGGGGIGLHPASYSEIRTAR